MADTIFCSAWSAARISLAAVRSSKARAAVLLAAVISPSEDNLVRVDWRKLYSSYAKNARPVTNNTAPLVNKLTVMSFCFIGVSLNNMDQGFWRVTIWASLNNFELILSSAELEASGLI